MTRRSILTTLIGAAFAVAVATTGGRAGPAQPTTSPRPTASDPCGGPGRLLATANRPTIGYSTCAVERGTAVFELGYQNEVRGTATEGAVESQVPQSFTRLGVAPRFEFDVIGPNYVALRTYPTPSGVFHGVTDSGLGFKYELPPGARWMVAFDGLYTGPNGSPPLSAGNATLTGNVDASYSLSPAINLGTTVAVSSTGSFSHGTHYRYGVTTPSVVVTFQAPNYYQFYAEYVLVSKISGTLGDNAFTDFGIQKLLGRRTELDVEYGHAFTSITRQRFNYIGSGLVLQVW